jgi:hypothetical protein
MSINQIMVMSSMKTDMGPRQIQIADAVWQTRSDERREADRLFEECFVIGYGEEDLRVPPSIVPVVFPFSYASTYRQSPMLRKLDEKVALHGIWSIEPVTPEEIEARLNWQSMPEDQGDLEEEKTVVAPRSRKPLPQIPTREELMAIPGEITLDEINAAVGALQPMRASIGEA